MGSSSPINKTNHRRKRKPKTICVSFASESDYHACMEDAVAYRTYLTQMFEHHPELFPKAMANGFFFTDFYTRKSST